MVSTKNSRGSVRAVRLDPGLQAELERWTSFVGLSERCPPRFRLILEHLRGILQVRVGSSPSA